MFSSVILELDLLKHSPAKRYILSAVMRSSRFCISNPEAHNAVHQHYRQLPLNNTVYIFNVKLNLEKIVNSFIKDLLSYFGVYYNYWVFNCLTDSVCKNYISPPHCMPFDFALCSIVQLHLCQRCVISAH